MMNTRHGPKPEKNERSEITKKEFSAGIIIFRRTKEGPKFLVLYHGGPYWNFPKGKLEGETNFKAALREVQEETGIVEHELKFKSWFKVQDKFTYSRNRERIAKVVTYYLAETRQKEVKIKIVPDTHEGEQHEGYGWFLYRDAVRLLISPTLKQNLKKAYFAITKKKPNGPRPPHPSRLGLPRLAKGETGRAEAEALRNGPVRPPLARPTPKPAPQKNPQ